ncbi:hypothetical protein GZH47_33220 (plasmid) [Paenibacillus rhizovicinus]|uniref:LytTR family transcriptional regulator n=1 Tax=Paenibacillus rhizovicinus TaxID=2704463 RepID=A0A6C0PBD2_9BACL|nr:hypothetical protein [Paenibacillus rhizovicinus]QHW35756.1 hypothetical protein GZH47_33220 [Paenibacillus rhizovicinus]
MDLPAISHDGSPVLLDESDIFSVRLLGRRIVMTTVTNEEYYWPLSIDDVSMFFGPGFEISDRKNIFNAEKIKNYDSSKGAVYSDEVVTNKSASVALNDTKMREIKRKLGKEKDIASDWEY